MARRAGCEEDLPAAVDAALAALDAEGLRAILRDLTPWLDESNYARLSNALVDRAARNSSSWSPEGPTDAEVSAVLAFAEAAAREGCADPSEVDGYLQQGVNAFLGKNYPAAFRIFRALLPPIANADIDLGQHEMVDEVLGVEVADCAAQYVVCTYMTATPQNRGKAVLTAIDDVSGVGRFWEPLAEMERVAVEPLPGFTEFLPPWRGFVEEKIPEKHESDWDTDEQRWLREVIGRMEGVDGLAAHARSTGRAEDLQVWCRTLLEEKNWEGALQAYEEAAVLVNSGYWCGAFLDAAALAANELGRENLSSLLESAWRAQPSMTRLRTWLGTQVNEVTVLERARAALEACPKEAPNQRALLQVLLGDLVSAAGLLASAPGLGWSGTEHPGRLLFPLFSHLLGADGWAHELGYDADESSPWMERASSELPTPGVPALLELAGITQPQEETVRKAMLAAMRTAAERRIRGVTRNKRRSYYGHAASLALACGQIDPTSGGRAWLAALRHTYRRYPALQREFSEVGSRR